MRRGSGDSSGRLEHTSASSASDHASRLGTRSNQWASTTCAEGRESRPVPTLTASSARCRFARHLLADNEEPLILGGKALAGTIKPGGKLGFAMEDGSDDDGDMFAVSRLRRNVGAATHMCARC